MINLENRTSTTIYQRQAIPSYSFSIRKRIQVVLLVLLASGMLFNNILLTYVMGYPVTFTTICAVLLYLTCLPDWLGRRSPIRLRLVFFLLTFVYYELVVHGLLMDTASETEWWRSYALLLFSIGLPIAFSKTTISINERSLFVKMISWVAYIMGGLGVVQFILINTVGYWLSPVPNALLYRVPDIILDSNRFAGLVRAEGISYEYSYYGIGMVVVFALCMILLDLFPPQPGRIFFRYGSLVMALFGVIVSVSLTAWGFLAVVLLAGLVDRLVRKTKLRKPLTNHSVASQSGNLRPQNKKYHRNTKWLLVIGAVILVVSGWYLGPFLAQRWSNLLAGTDNSASRRLSISIESILQPANDLFTSFVGLGLGLDNTSTRLREIFYNYYTPQYMNYLDNKITLINGFSYIAITMGWLGLGLLAIVIYEAQKNNKFSQVGFFLPLGLIIGYTFTNGRILEPDWWALLVVIMLINSSGRRSPQVISYE